jgi:head-tail adaptor
VQKPTGQYTERVRLLKRTLAAADATGQQVESWPETSGDRWLWCRVEMLNGMERVAAAGVQSNMAVRVSIPGRVMGIEAVDRLKHLDAVYVIGGVFFDGHDVVCDCRLPAVA